MSANLDLVLAVDNGRSSVRAMILDAVGNVTVRSQREKPLHLLSPFKLILPKC
jgi:glycerol kinase